ncbi:hypothetical protein [Mangrovimonas futianensis]|uniref:hypothetical protein n=1 Tax=Mangrovimonas futianensis TaxID=2895523 RepID=UPI001E46AE93|nr:hypothetical protein [Mangrovimonas futianensis]MCF1420566.1 hypothetical protein [Mangrovimonas futianensis]
MRITLFLLLFALTVNSQTKIDEVISVEFPGSVKKYEQLESGAKAVGYHFQNENDSFVFVRSVPVDLGGIEIKDCSSSLFKLRSNYKLISNQVIEMLKGKKFDYSNSIQIFIDDFEAYKMIFIDRESEIKTAECLILQLNGVQYYGIYAMVKKFDEDRKNDFFSSLKIQHPDRQKQIR